MLIVPSIVFDCFTRCMTNYNHSQIGSLSVIDTIINEQE